MSNKETNEMIKHVSLTAGDALGGSACRSCKEAYCCSYQVEVGITSSEFDAIAHLVTPEQIERAKIQLNNPSPIVIDGRATYRCPFLSEEGRCEIYDERFMICAIYSVVGNNHQCSLDNKGGRVAVVNPAEVIINAAKTYLKVRDRMLFHIDGNEEPSDVLIEFKKRYLNDK